jgi:integrase
LAATGVRRGEACALRWSDIDWEEGALRVDEAVVAAPGGALVKSPKTRASIRTVALDPATMALLSKLHDRNRTLADDCELDLVDDGFIFSVDATGKQPPHPDAMSQAFSRVRKLAGVAADIHLHSLRHFHATVLDSVVMSARSRPVLAGRPSR